VLDRAGLHLHLESSCILPATNLRQRAEAASRYAPPSLPALHSLRLRSLCQEAPEPEDPEAPVQDNPEVGVA
jgi:hypothetical protein